MGRFTTPVGKITYAGIDFHKKFSVIALGDQDGRLVEQHKILNDEHSVRSFWKQHTDVRAVIETCRASEWYIALLKEFGICIVVADARKIKLIAESKHKNDKVDSRILMELLAKDYIPSVYQPTVQEKALLERIRWRMHLVRMSVRVKLRIHALLDKENRGFLGVDIFTVAGRNLLDQVQLSSPRDLLLKKHLMLLDALQLQIHEEDTWVTKEAKALPAAVLLKTIPGIGNLSALVLAARIGSVSRFQRAEQLSRYFGLVPRERSSANRQWLGGVTKEGCRLCRWILVEDAWHAIRKNTYLRQRFEEISKRRGRNVAIVAIARKLAEIAFCVLRDQKPFDPSRLAAGPARPSPCTPECAS